MIFLCITINELSLYDAITARLGLVSEQKFFIFCALKNKKTFDLKALCLNILGEDW